MLDEIVPPTVARKVDLGCLFHQNSDQILLPTNIKQIYIHINAYIHGR
jgi:hypothetical protein